MRAFSLVFLLACHGGSSDLADGKGRKGGGGTDPSTTTYTPDDPTPPTTSTTEWTTPPDTEPTTTSRRHDCSGMDPADAAPLNGKVILTFDDGPDAVDTPDILATLRTYGIPATFFVTGEALSDPAVWSIAEDIADDPMFDLANHSWDHADLATLSVSAAEDEIDDTTALIRTFGVEPRFFRFPYGDSTCTTHDLVTDRGLNVTGWHIDTADWCYAAMGTPGRCTADDYWRVPPEYEADMRGWILEQVRRFDGGVVLFHDIHSFTAANLENVILDLLADGFTFTSLDDAATLPNLNAGTPTDLPYLGEACDLANDLCWQVEYFAWCEPVDPGNPADTRGVCTMPCEGYCLDRDGAATTFCAETAGAGQCIGKSQEINAWCANVPGTSGSSFDRHVGGSGAPAASSTVCAPTWW